MKCRHCQAEFLNTLKECPFCGTAVSPEDAEAAAADPENRAERLNRDERLRESDRKHSKKGWIILGVILALVIGLVAYGLIDQADKNRPRNMETDTLAEGYCNVSVELVSFNPEYEVYRKSSASDTVGVDYTNGYLCRGETVNGNTVWIYARKIDSRYGRLITGGPQRLNYPPEDPLKLTGRVTQAKYIAENISSEIGEKTFVLEVDKYPEAYKESGE